MNTNQKQFYQFIMERVKEEYDQLAKELLLRSFQKQDEGKMDQYFFMHFEKQIGIYTKEENRKEVLEVIQAFQKIQNQ